MTAQRSVDERLDVQPAPWSLRRPVDYSGPGAYRRPPDSYLRLQWLGPLLTRLGLSPRDVIFLEVPGRRSGVIRRTSLVRARCAGGSYLVALAGESEWVRNVRAAGGRATIGRRQRRSVRLTEIPDAQRPAVLRAYVLRWGRRPDSPAVAREARYFLGVDPELTEEQLRTVAPRHPVFLVRPAAGTMESLLPRPDVDLLHTVVLPAPAPVGFRTVVGVDLSRVPLFRALVGIGGLSSRLTGRGVRRDADEHEARRSFRIADLTSAGWTVLREAADEEVVFGQITRPWEPPWTSTVELQGPDDFIAFDRPGFTKVALGVRVDPYATGACLLTVQTRLSSTDEPSRRWVRRNRWLVGPFSELIRRVAVHRVLRDLAHSRPSR